MAAARETETPFRRGLSLKYQVAVAVILLIVGVTGGVTAVVRGQVRASLISQMMDKGRVLVRVLAGNAVEAVATGERVRLALLADETKKQGEDIFAAAVAGPDGVVMAHTDYTLEGKPYPRPAGVQPQVQGAERVSRYAVDGEEILDFESDLTLTSPDQKISRTLGRAHVLFSLGPIRAIVNRTLQNIFFVALCGLGLGILVSIWLAAWITRPVQELARAAGAVGAGDLDLRIPVTRRDELGQLSVAFNHMAGNLKRAQAERIVKERLQHEMEIAQRIQNLLVPKSAPRIAGFSVGMLYRAAEEVSGDYYDFLDLGRGAWGMTVGDVSGKGVPGALVMVETRSALRSFALSTRSPREVLSLTNRQLSPDLPENMFITLSYLVLDPAARTATISRAGHLAALVYRQATGACEREQSAGIAIGIADPGTFDGLLTEGSIRLQPGDMILLYTDGLDEAVNAGQELFGSQRLVDVLKRAAGQDAQAIVAELDRAVRAFTGEAPQADDMTMILLKVEGKG